MTDTVNHSTRNLLSELYKVHSQINACPPEEQG